MGNGTFCAPDLTTYCGLGELGLVVVAARFVAPSNNEAGVVQVLRSLLGLCVLGGRKLTVNLNF